MQETEKYMPSILSTISRSLVWGFLFALSFPVAASFVFLVLTVLSENSMGNPVWLLYLPFRWPTGAFTGFIFGAVLALLMRSTVELTGKQILIHTPLRRKSFHVSEFQKPVITHKTHILSYGKFTTVKCRLVFHPQVNTQSMTAPTVSENYQVQRLYGFREKELEILLAAIRRRQMSQLSSEEKIMIQEQYQEDIWKTQTSENETGCTFSIPASALVSKEKKWLQKLTVILICVIAVIGGLDLLEINSSHVLDIRLLFLTLLALAIPVLLLSAWVSLYFRRKICAESITIGPEYLSVNGNYYSFSALYRLKLTSPRKRSSSAFPVQHYMYLTTSGGTEKYWLGSEASFDEYSILCGQLENALIFFPDKLEYVK